LVGFDALVPELADESVVELSVLLAAGLDSFESPGSFAGALLPSLPSDVPFLA